MSGWRRMVPVARAGRIEHHDVERAPRRPGRQRRPRPPRPARRRRARFVAQTLERAGRHIDRGDLRAGRGQLRRLAAGRRAQVGDGLARDVAGEARHQRGGRILHPPGAVGEARQILDAAVRGRAGPSRSAAACRRAARPRPARRRRCPASEMSSGASLQAGLGDAPRRLGAVGGRPALPQPVGDVEPHAILAGEQARPALGDAPQHGVDELGEAMRAAVAPRRSTAISTTACGGMPRQTSCAAPASRIGHSRPLSAGSGCSRKALSTCSSSPCRRSTVAAIARASARSRASSAACSGRADCSASTCSSGRLCMSTPAMRCTASSRAASPAWLALTLGFFCPVRTLNALRRRPIPFACASAVRMAAPQQEGRP